MSTTIFFFFKLDQVWVNQSFLSDTGLDTSWMDLLKGKKFLGVLVLPIYHLPDLPLTCASVVTVVEIWNAANWSYIVQGVIVCNFLLAPTKICFSGQLGNR